jgi:glycosyltransferase involved in cell wall biosynthesis
MPDPVFSGRLALQQRLFPAYRAPFFEALAEACRGGLSIFAGQPLPEENVVSGDHLEKAVLVQAHNLNILPITSPFYQCWQSGLIRWLEEWQPDALIVEANTRYPNTRRAVRWMHHRGKPVLGWGLGAPPITANSRLLKTAAPLRHWERASLLRSLDGVIAYSRRGAEEYRRAGIPGERIFVAPNAAAFRPRSAPPVRPDLSGRRPTVLFVGRLQKRKRIDLLLRACAALPASLQPRLWIVGEGPAREGIQQMAGEIYPEAEFFGAIHGPELEKYFRAADLFVLPGTGGLAVQQAMAFALPVVVAQGDGTQEDLVSRENGVLIPPDELLALENALKALLSNPPLLRRMGAESYRIVSEEVNIENMVASFVYALQSVFSAAQSAEGIYGI